jgi:chromosome segregation ATPase
MYSPRGSLSPSRSSPTSADLAIRKYRRDIAELSAQVDALKDRLEESEMGVSRLASLEDQRSRLVSEIASLQRDLTQELARESLSDELAEVNRKYDNLLRKYTRLQSQYDDLKVDYEASVAETEALSGPHSPRAKISQLETDLSTTRDSLSTSRKRQRQLDSDLTSLGIQKSLVDEQLADVTRDNAALVKRNKELQEKERSLQTSAREAVDLRVELQALRAENRELRVQNAGLEDKVRYLTQKNRDQASAIDDLDREVVASQRSSPVVKDLRSQLSEAQESASTLASKAKKLSTTIDDLQRENTVLSARNARLVAENANLRSGSDSTLREQRAKIADLTSKNRELENDNSALLAENRELSNSASSEEVNASLAEKEQELEAAERKNSRLAAQVADRLSLRRQLDELKDENASLRDEVARKTAENESLLDDLNDSRALAAPKPSAILEEHERLRTMVGVLAERNAALRQSSLSPRGSPTSSPRLDQQYREENQDLRKQIRELELERTEKEVENQSLRARCARLQRLNSSGEEVREVYEQIRSDNEELNDENSRLKRTIARLSRSPSPPRSPYRT